MRNLLLICSIFSFFLAFTTPAQANEPILLNLTEWEVKENSRFDDPSKPCLERDGPSKWEERDGGLGILIDQSLPCQTVIAPKDRKYFGLRRYSLRFSMKIDEILHDHNILILWQDRENFIDLHLFGNFLEYAKYVQGKQVYSVRIRHFLEQKSEHIYRIEHDESTGVTKMWRDGLPFFTVIEPENTPALGQSWIGFRASVGAQRTSDVTFKDLYIDEVGTASVLSVPFIKQNNPLWGNLEYNSASEWSNERPTLARWGCALTSAVMVMRSYGITHFADGTVLQPDTVNTWLKSQKDGYLGQGHLNWRALTRLAYQLAATYGTTKLEFSYEYPADKLPWLKETLQAGKPVILDLEGHFAVAYGNGPGSNDFSLHDPLFPIEKLKDYKNTFVSARLFTPSQTDLSAITIVLPLTVSLKVFDQNSHPISFTSILLPPLFDPENPQSTQRETLQLFDIPKPSSQSIVFQLQAPQKMEVALKMFTYTREGESQVFEKVVSLDTADGTSVVLSINDTENSLLSTPLSLSTENLTLASEKTPFFSSLIQSWKV